MLLAMPAAGFATVPVAGKDCVELEHADKATEKTAMAVSRGRFNASTFHERSAMGCRGYVAWERLTSWVRAVAMPVLKRRFDPMSNVEGIAESPGGMMPERISVRAGALIRRRRQLERCAQPVTTIA